MKKIVAFVGSARKRHTYQAVEQLLEGLRAFGDVECEIVSLGDARLESCRGCLSCFDQGEEHCPRRDDRDLLIGKIEASDGVVFATPNYSFQVSGLMKTFLDRLGFLYHRPRFHGKAFTAIVAQGIFGGRAILKYLDFAANGLGFNTVKGSCLQTIEPVRAKAARKNDRAIARHARRMHARLTRPAFPTPSFIQLMVFRMSRTRIRTMLDGRSRDFTWYADRGWLTSDYYYPTRLGLVKRAVGSLFDLVAGSLA